MKTYTTEAGARRNARKRDILCIRSASGDLFVVGLEAGAEITVIDGTGEETKSFRFDDVPAFSARNGGAADDDGGL